MAVSALMAGDEYAYDPADPVRARMMHMYAVPTVRLGTTADVAVASAVVDQLAVARFDVAHLYWKWSAAALAGLASHESVRLRAARVMAKPVGRHGPLVVCVTATELAAAKPDFSPRSQTV